MIRKKRTHYFSHWSPATINKEMPINLREFEAILQRVHERYPNVKKSQIALVIKCFMEEIREELLNSTTINLVDFAVGMRLYSYYQMNKEKLAIYSTVQLTTPKKIREKC